MSAFNSIFGAARAALQGTFGRTITFQPLNRDAPRETVTPIQLGAIEAVYEDQYPQTVKEQRRDLIVPLATAEGGPSEFLRGGFYTIPALLADGTSENQDWTLHQVSRLDRESGQATLDLRRPVRINSSSPAERVRR